MCTKATLTKKMERLAQLRKQIDELEFEKDEIEQFLKDEMTKRGQYELKAGDHKVTWNEVTSNRFDSARFKKDAPGLYESYLKPSTTRRFLFD